MKLPQLKFAYDICVAFSLCGPSLVSLPTAVSHNSPISPGVQKVKGTIYPSAILM